MIGGVAVCNRMMNDVTAFALLKYYGVRVPRMKAKSTNKVSVSRFYFTLPVSTSAHNLTPDLFLQPLNHKKPRWRRKELVINIR